MFVQKSHHLHGIWSNCPLSSSSISTSIMVGRLVSRALRTPRFSIGLSTGYHSYVQYYGVIRIESMYSVRGNPTKVDASVTAYGKNCITIMIQSWRRLWLNSMYFTTNEHMICTVRSHSPTSQAGTGWKLLPDVRASSSAASPQLSLNLTNHRVEMCDYVRSIHSMAYLRRECRSWQQKRQLY